MSRANGQRPKAYVPERIDIFNYLEFLSPASVIPVEPPKEVVVIPLDVYTGTPQQIRLLRLQASRNWGPFTSEEHAHMDSALRSHGSWFGRREWMAPDLNSLIRYVDIEERLC